MFPFARFPGVDTVLGPEMSSTGEVMGIDRDFAVAFAKSQLGGGTQAAAHRHGVRLGQGRRQGQGRARRSARLPRWASASSPPAAPRHLDAHGIACERVNKVLEGRPHIVDAIKNGEVQIVFNTTEGAKALAEFVLDPPLGLALPYSLLYNRGWRPGRDRGDQGPAGRNLTVAPLQS